MLDNEHAQSLIKRFKEMYMDKHDDIAVLTAL